METRRISIFLLKIMEFGWQQIGFFSKSHIFQILPKMSYIYNKSLKTLYKKKAHYFIMSRSFLLCIRLPNIIVIPIYTLLTYDYSLPIHNNFSRNYFILIIEKKNWKAWKFCQNWMVRIMWYTVNFLINEWVLLFYFI